MIGILEFHDKLSLGKDIYFQKEKRKKKGSILKRFSFNANIESRFRI